tara:strand:- start:34 stop:522 length:489 start_codon:yes stop_codon:yes gene_type:complete
MSNLKFQPYFNFVLIISLVSLISAYFIEFVLGYQPCNLCLIERIPYWLSLILIFTIYVYKKNERFFILLLILIFVFSFFISVYHFGIEQGFFKESSVCGLKNAADLITKDELLKQLNEKNISCKDVTFRIFGLSLTSINIVINILILITLYKILIKYEKVRH